MSTEAKLYGLGELNRQLEELAAGFKAGGNFGHVGRPGQVGGSAPGHVSVNTVRPRPYEGDKTRFLPDNGQKVPDKYTERHARFVGDVNESESMRFIATKEGNIFWLPEIANNVDHHQISAYHELDWLKEGEGFNGFLCSKKGLSDGTQIIGVWSVLDIAYLQK